jgi:gamma-glutamylcyclotransferase (GGCT)/AIG2-like uncharacterized protein YtfP
MALSPTERKLLLANAALLGLTLTPERAAEAVRAQSEFASAHTRLAIYGSLGPGRENEHVMTAIGGSWREGYSIAGTRLSKGWGASLGYPGVRWEAGVGRIDVSVFDSEALPLHWADLDGFEGDEYARLYVSLWRNGEATDVAFAYTIRESSAAMIAELLSTLN